MNIIVIAGAPDTGKTTFSKKLETSMPVIHTDDYKDIPWEDQSKVLATRILDSFNSPIRNCIVIEGLCALRGVRKAVEYGWVQDGPVHMGGCKVTVFMFDTPYGPAYDASAAKAQRTILEDLVKKFPNTTVYNVKGE